LFGLNNFFLSGFKSLLGFISKKLQGKKVHLNAQGAKNVPIVARSRVVAVPNFDFRSPAHAGAGFTIP